MVVDSGLWCPYPEGFANSAFFHDSYNIQLMTQVAKQEKINSSDSLHFPRQTSHKPKHDMLNMGRWTAAEDAKYLEFLIAHRPLFERGLNKRSTRVFKKLAHTIPGRNPEQCRSHHLKLARTCCGSLDLLVEYVERKLRVSCDQGSCMKGKQQNENTKYGDRNFSVQPVEVLRKGPGVRTEIIIKVEISVASLQEW